LKDRFTPLIVKSFWKKWHFKWVFALLPLNYLVEGYAKYIWYVKKKQSYHMILSCSIAPSSFLTAWNSKTKNLNKYKISKINVKNKIKLQCLKYVHIKKIDNAKMREKKVPSHNIPWNNTLFAIGNVKF
jgi:hypothetical protein